MSGELGRAWEEYADLVTRVVPQETDREQLLIAARRLVWGEQALNELEELAPVLGCHNAPLPVLGVDGCPAGWIGVLLLPRDPEPAVCVAPTISELMAWARAEDDVSLVAIDIPIGLPDDSLRRADRLARAKLRNKASTVFSVLTRDAYAAPDRATADIVNRSRVGQGVGAQAFALRNKIIEVDQWVRGGPGLPVLEAHPELCFTELVGSPIAANKKTPAGQRLRRNALHSVGIDPPEQPPSGAAVDDLLDACVVAWTAARAANRAAYSLPHPPERFSDGLDAAIWV